MIEIILEIIMAGSGLLVLVSLIMIFREHLLMNKLCQLTLSDLPVKKITYCQLVLDWCHDNIALPNTKKPTVRLNYYSHKEFGGYYDSEKNECVIYVNSYDTILGVTNAVIHEYVHSRQSSRSFGKMYKRYQSDFGYENNPFELESRELASKHEQTCLLWVCQQFD